MSNSVKKLVQLIDEGGIKLEIQVKSACNRLRLDKGQVTFVTNHFKLAQRRNKAVL